MPTTDFVDSVLLPRPRRRENRVAASTSRSAGFGSWASACATTSTWSAREPSTLAPAMTSNACRVRSARGSAAQSFPPFRGGHRQRTPAPACSASTCPAVAEPVSSPSHVAVVLAIGGDRRVPASLSETHLAQRVMHGRADDTPARSTVRAPTTSPISPSACRKAGPNALRRVVRVPVRGRRSPSSCGAPRLTPHGFCHYSIVLRATFRAVQSQSLPPRATTATSVCAGHAWRLCREFPRRGAAVVAG